MVGLGGEREHFHLPDKLGDSCRRRTVVHGVNGRVSVVYVVVWAAILTLARSTEPDGVGWMGNDLESDWSPSIRPREWGLLDCVLTQCMRMIAIWNVE